MSNRIAVVSSASNSECSLSWQLPARQYLRAAICATPQPAMMRAARRGLGTMGQDGEVRDERKRSLDGGGSRIVLRNWRRATVSGRRRKATGRGAVRGLANLRDAALSRGRAGLPGPHVRAAAGGAGAVSRTACGARGEHRVDRHADRPRAPARRDERVRLQPARPPALGPRSRLLCHGPDGSERHAGARGTDRAWTYRALDVLLSAVA